MSVILDALRRAEQERKLGQAPNVQVITQMPAGTARAKRPPTGLWVGLILLVLAVAALSVWLLRAPPAATTTAEEQIPAPVPATAPAPAAPVVAASAPEPAPRIVPQRARIESLDDLLPTPKPPAKLAVRAPEPPAPSAAAPALDPFDARGELAPPDGPIDRSEVAPPKPSAARAAPAVASGPPLLREMPSEFRDSFPGFSVDVHVYNVDPAKRWVMIDLRKYVEGQSLDGGPRIGEIRPDGIVFEWRGRQVLYPLQR